MSLAVEVLEHLIQPPAANAADDIGVDVSTQKGNCPCCTEVAGGDIGGKKSELRAKEADGFSQSGGDQRGLDDGGKSCGCSVHPS